MAKTKQRPQRASPWAWIAGVIIVSAALLASIVKPRSSPPRPQAEAAKVAAAVANTSPVTTNPPLTPVKTNAPVNTPLTPAGTNAPLSSTMEINQAMMVTVDLDFGGTPTTIAEALNWIERRYAPAEGKGRTFAILDAFGEPTPENKLRVSMHVSSEKIGTGEIVFRRTGEVLWRGRFIPMAPDKKPPATGGQNLMILVDNGKGKLWTVDGSNNPASVLDANVKELGQPLREVWLDGQEREVTFLYSSCGCPVKVMVRREGARTRRTKELPVIFPDDPAVVSVISALMRW